MNISESDPLRQYSEHEDRQLLSNLLEITERVHSGALIRSAPIVDLLCSLHRSVFAGVRDHAGRIRRPGEGSEYVTYGPHRSAKNTEVPDLLERVMSELDKAIRSFDDHPDDADYESSALRVAVWSHSEVIRIHPFEDGNGRSARLLLSWILVRVGLRPIALEVVKEDYLTCLNHYLVTDDIGPLLDMYLRLYSVG